MALEIRTNNIPRDVVYGYELTPDEAAEFDYIDNLDEFSGHAFMRYKGHTYDLSEFMRVPAGMFGDENWDGYASDSYFSGVLIKFTDDSERVVCATYIS